MSDVAVGGSGGGGGLGKGRAKGSGLELCAGASELSWAGTYPAPDQAADLLLPQNYRQAGLRFPTSIGRNTWILLLSWTLIYETSHCHYIFTAVHRLLLLLQATAFRRPPSARLSAPLDLQPWHSTFVCILHLHGATALTQDKACAPAVWSPQS